MQHWLTQKVDDDRTKVLTALTELCQEYQSGAIRPALFEVFVEGAVITFGTPIMSELYRRVERTVGEHHCAFWADCKPACMFETLPDLWAEWSAQVEPLELTIIEELIQ